MSRSVVVQQPADSLASQIGSIYRMLKGRSCSEPLEFDLRGLNWAQPTLVLALASHLDSVAGSLVIPSQNPDVCSYLRTVGFPRGVSGLSAFEAACAVGRTYSPIGILLRDGGSDREQLETMFQKLVVGFVGDTTGSRTALIYPLAELISNIFEHGDVDRGYVFGQYYPARQELEICVLDRGQGLASRYKQSKNLDYTDAQAIEQAMRGVSAKRDKSRGYGISTSKRMVCEGLRGQFVLLTGSSALLADETGDWLVDLTDFDWQGTIVCWRMKKPTESVEYTRFIE
jgi:hypothetical protein